MYIVHISAFIIVLSENILMHFLVEVLFIFSLSSLLEVKTSPQST